ncbi:hypothetical protein Y695_02161 [Hydrogenophaga sp. T4]|nr:hypothetical protein Y695_02161 [Hydrogenophaga sp. T4]
MTAGKGCRSMRACGTSGARVSTTECASAFMSTGTASRSTRTTRSSSSMSVIIWPMLRDERAMRPNMSRASGLRCSPSSSAISDAKPLTERSGARRSCAMEYEIASMSFMERSSSAVRSATRRSRVALSARTSS